MSITKLTQYRHDETGLNFHFRPLEDTLDIEKTDTGYTVRYLIQDDFSEAPDDYPDIILVSKHRDFYVGNDVIKNLNIGEYYCFPVEAYIHSGVVLAFSEEGNFPDRRWDVSQCAVIYVRRGYDATNRSQARELAWEHLTQWNMYLEGDVYSLVTEYFTAEKKPIDYELLGGIYGYENACQELKSEINNIKEYVKNE